MGESLRGTRRTGGSRNEVERTGAAMAAGGEGAHPTSAFFGVFECWNVGR